ncbi:MAG: DUF1501 domain-containing protein [Gemmataceae bacterium]
MQFAFLEGVGQLAKVPAQFTRHGQSGMDYSTSCRAGHLRPTKLCLVRSMHTEAFNHHPGQLMNTGVPTFGRPSMGSWLTYGLGNESKNLPGYVVLTSGREHVRRGEQLVERLSADDLPGVLFRNRGEPILNLTNPRGLSGACRSGRSPPCGT